MLDEHIKKEDYISAANTKNTLKQLEQQQEELNASKTPTSDEKTEVKVSIARANTVWRVIVNL